MPYTPCHMAIMIPVSRRPLVPSALAVGAMTPDIEYFLSCSLIRSEIHAWPDGLLWGVPLGLAALWLWHAVLKRPFLMLLPEQHQERLVRHAEAFCFLPASRFCWILVSIVLGIASHILWDAFTHADGWFVAAIPCLRIELLELSRLRIPVYRLLQHVSSFVGGAAMCIWYLNWYSQARPDPLPTTLTLTPEAKAISILCLFLATILPACVRMLPGLWRVRDLESFSNVAGQAAITGFTCGAIAAIILSLLLIRHMSNLKSVWNHPIAERC